jgi:hypothetical protein
VRQHHQQRLTKQQRKHMQKYMRKHKQKHTRYTLTFTARPASPQCVSIISSASPAASPISVCAHRRVCSADSAFADTAVAMATMPASATRLSVTSNKRNDALAYDPMNSATAAAPSVVKPVSAMLSVSNDGGADANKHADRAVRD